MLLTLVGSIFADNLTVSDIELKAGNSQDVAISLINASKKYTAFQFDIVLPEGISIAKNDKGKLMVTLNAERIDDHTLNVQDLGSNTYRFLSFSLTNAEFYGTSGALVNMTLQADEAVSVGLKEGVIVSQVFTETDGNQVNWDDTPFSISIKDESGSVVGNLTISDIVLKVGGAEEMTIGLNNASKKYTAFQFDIVLPEGISIAKNDKGKLMVTLNADRIDDHTLNVQDLGSNTYRFLCFSLTNAEFYGTSGALVNMTLQADENVGLGVKKGVMKSQVLTETDGNQVNWDDVSFSISVEEAGPAVTKGDVNGDGDVDIADAVCIVNYVVGKPNTTFIEAAADANGDDDIDIADAVHIVNYVVGKIPALVPRIPNNLPDPE